MAHILFSTRALMADMSSKLGFPVTREYLWMFAAQVDKNHWQVVKSTYLNGVYLYEGDEIRLEKSVMTDLRFAAELLNRHLKKDDRRVVFYHLDTMVIEQFEVSELQEILDDF